MNEMPDLVLVCVGAWLPLRYVGKFARVCRKWSSVISLPEYWIERSVRWLSVEGQRAISSGGAVVYQDGLQIELPPLAYINYCVTSDDRRTILVPDNNPTGWTYYYAFVGQPWVKRTLNFGHGFASRGLATISPHGRYIVCDRRRPLEVRFQTCLFRRRGNEFHLEGVFDLSRSCHTVTDDGVLCGTDCSLINVVMGPSPVVRHESDIEQYSYTGDSAYIYYKGKAVYGHVSYPRSISFSDNQTRVIICTGKVADILSLPSFAPVGKLRTRGGIDTRDLGISADDMFQVLCNDDRLRIMFLENDIIPF